MPVPPFSQVFIFFSHLLLRNGTEGSSQPFRALVGKNNRQELQGFRSAVLYGMVFAAPGQDRIARTDRPGMAGINHTAVASDDIKNLFLILMFVQPDGTTGFQGYNPQ